MALCQVITVKIVDALIDEINLHSKGAREAAPISRVAIWAAVQLLPAAGLCTTSLPMVQTGLGSDVDVLARVQRGSHAGSVFFCQPAGSRRIDQTWSGTSCSARLVIEFGPHQCCG